MQHKKSTVACGYSRGDEISVLTVRSADSQSLILPKGSLYVYFTRRVHTASDWSWNEERRPSSVWHCNHSIMVETVHTSGSDLMTLASVALGS